MIIINPNVEYLRQSDKVSHVASCARVCYGKESGDDKRLYDSLEANGHWSMFRHETYYAAVPVKGTNDIIYLALKGFQHCPYINYVTYNDYCYIVTNGNFIRDYRLTNPYLVKAIIEHGISLEEAENVEPIWRNHIRYTFKITTQISTSRELNRVSPNNIAELSTRYVDLKNGAIVRPHWMSDEIAQGLNNFDYWDLDKLAGLPKPTVYYMNGVEHGFEMYRNAVNAGMKKEDARGILPLDTATVVVYTYNVNTWRHIIELRSSKHAHPNAKIVADLIQEQLEELGYDFK